ncbi:Rrna biogenesis protein-like protein [Leptomonas pyrrhocoris]|uniref:Rrna biogenesis protein-like protein n=1 Tax=Leptomonas pyrrhocoris TaxID=157538 RepID=A0A0N0DS29_LEPPY|nr:Rrna biogenesis protein-like protein [Leptomonas pyrrhocoris]KPA75334.1 Rrna biogenesis protein-like protein [Leptomonas pyrrhocoris]|eukprot:XP_015653773.1 Rrna biogenesis protein-like protein [Leptomonas pyrrhocoris]
MSSCFREYRVQHSTPDGILVQLPETNGFGRLTKATLGGDLLAERLLKSFSAREHVVAIPQRARDAQGYRLLTVNLREGYSALLTYPLSVQQLAQRLLRKHMLVGIGTTTAARVVRASAKGSVLTIAPNLTAVAAFENLANGAPAPPSSSSATAGKQHSGAAGSADVAAEDSSDDDVHNDSTDQRAHEHTHHRGSNAVEVRLLNYDVTADVVNVTAKTEVVEGTPFDTAVSAAALSSLHSGDVVSCTVLLSSTDDGCAVVQIPVQMATLGEHDGDIEESPLNTTTTITVLGYYLYDWAGAKTSSSAAPVVGHTLELVIEFCPELPALYDVMPFVILSNRTRTFQHLPAVRRPATTAAAGAGSAAALATTSYGLLGHFPWRAEYTAKTRRSEESEDEDDEAAEGGRGSAGEDAPQRTRRRKLEEAIDAYERGMDKATPTSPEEFQRLLLANPNSSYLWTQFMAHHVGLQQYEAARQVAEKALSTIGVREKDELLNVWVAYLNVENLYGTEESLAAVFRRAQQRQLHQLELYERLADIYAAARKPNQLLALCRVMTSKFRHERRTWERLGVVLVDQGKRDQLKRTLKDMGEVLKRDDASLAIVHIAIHEYKHGSPENGRALFEGLLRKVPKRSDVWSTYIDQETGLLNRKEPSASALQVRQIFQRTVAMNFSAKVMQQLLTRFLSFEKLHGSPTDVEAVKERARAYVEAKIQAVTDSTVPSATS